ncbi:DNA repair protein RadA [Williamsia sterculiae]|uniref:DNA repair protein RadA n=1 Tax=Williamsia sterculiae TaxID=1344003 RepID=A0A1N7CTS2_9NOCA|nr:DNA repair protein RadA [Williamsia sterculiae]SIR66864.1 DNA repair protein RadA/Sms [Williamsia sterculiae]
MPKTRTAYRCAVCGNQLAKWVGRCPECGEWGSVDEVAVPSAAKAGSPAVVPTSAARPITEFDPNTSVASSTGIGELDRVLGSGVVPGSVILLAGEPGVGKSTLLLETARRWAEQGRTALYITGEESAGQVRLRAERTGAVNENIYLAAESDLATVLGHAEQVSPTLMIVDSVQTMVASHADGVTGGVTQIRSVTTALVSLAKNSGIAIVLVGHVTKDGAVAGPRSLEHLVDVVLSFEGDKHSSLRMVRGIKNRFGAADEVGCFEQRGDGIHEVPDPSGLFLYHKDSGVAGSAITVTMDGRRALVGEIQALVNETTIPSPRRAVSGLDSARVAMILAVLESRLGVKVGKADVYVATVGGMKITEPAIDLAVALAVGSMVRNRPLPRSTIAIGEVGLAGEVRRVSGAGRRVAEARRLGFRHAIVPAGSDEKMPSGIRVTEVGDLDAAVRAALSNAGTYDF